MIKVGSVYVDVEPDGAQWTRKVRQIVSSTPTQKIAVEAETASFNKSMAEIAKNTSVTVVAKLADSEARAALNRLTKDRTVNIKTTTSGSSPSLSGSANVAQVAYRGNTAQLLAVLTKDILVAQQAAPPVDIAMVVGPEAIANVVGAVAALKAVTPELKVKITADLDQGKSDLDTSLDIWLNELEADKDRHLLIQADLADLTEFKTDLTVKLKEVEKRTQLRIHAMFEQGNLAKLNTQIEEELQKPWGNSLHIHAVLDNLAYINAKINALNNKKLKLELQADVEKLQTQVAKTNLHKELELDVTKARLKLLGITALGDKLGRIVFDIKTKFDATEVGRKVADLKTLLSGITANIKTKIDTAVARVEATRFITWAKNLTANIKVNLQGLTAARTALAFLGKDRTVNLDVDAGAASAQVAGFGAASGASILPTLGLAAGARLLQNAIQGVGTIATAVTIIFGGTILVTVGLGAAVTALAVAANILGGALVVLPAAIVGITGALGVLLVALAPVIKAFTAWTALQTANGKVTNESAATQKNMAAAVRARQNAERDLAKAIQDASRADEDRRQKAIDGALAEQDANLALTQAKEKYAQVQADPNSTLNDIRQAELAIRQAQNNLSKQKTDNTRNQQDIDKTKQPGYVDPTVLDAQDRLKSAQDAVKDAVKGAATQQAAYNDTLSKLSPIGKDLLIVLQKGYDLFFAVSKIMQQIALPGVITFLENFMGLFGSINDQTKKFTEGPLLGSLKDLGGAVSGAAADFGKLFINKDFQDDLKAIIELAAEFIKLMGPTFVSIIQGLVGGLADMGKAAGPVLGAFADGMKSLGPSLKLFFDALSDPKVIGALAQGMGTLFSVIATSLPKFADFIGQLAILGGPIFEKLSKVGFFDALSTVLLQLAQGGIMDGFIAFMQGLTDALKALTDNSQGTSVMTQLAQAMGDMMKELGPMLPELFMSLVTAFIELVKFTPKVLEFIQFLIDNWKPLATGLAVVAAIFGGEFLLAIGAVVAGLGLFIAAWNWVTGLFSGGGSGSGIKKWLEDTFNFDVDKFIGPIKSGFTDLVNFLKDAWGMIAPIVKEIADFFVKKFEEIAPKIGPIFEKIGSIIGAAMTIIGGIIKAVVYIVMTLWDAFGHDLLDVISGAIDLVVGVFSGVVDIISGIFNLVAGLITGDWSQAWQGFKDIFTGAWDVIWSVLKAAGVLLKNAVEIIFDVFVWLFDKLWGHSILKDIWYAFRDAFNWINDHIKAVIGWVKDKLDDFVTGLGIIKDKVVGIWNNLLEFLGGLKQKVSDKLSGLWDGLKDTFRGVINWLIDQWNKLDLSIDIKVPDWVPGVGGKGFSVPDIFPDIPKLASGGIATKSILANIGEAGPEAVIPLNRLGQILKQHSSVGSTNGTGDSTKTVNVYQTINNPLPERATNSGPEGLRRAGYAL